MLELLLDSGCSYSAASEPKSQATQLPSIDFMYLSPQPALKTHLQIFSISIGKCLYLKWWPIFCTRTFYG